MVEIYTNKMGLNILCENGGTFVLTIADGVIVGGNVPCSGCWVKAEATKTVYINIGSAAANTNPIMDNSFIFLPVSNLNKLYFAGTNGDKVYIIYVT